MDVDFTGLEALTAQLRKMQNVEALESKTLTEAAEHMKKELESAAPVRTGKLKGNILISDITNSQIDVGASQQGDGFYGFFLEFGTSNLIARPWARPAWERNKRKVKEIMADELRKGMGL